MKRDMELVRKLLKLLNEHEHGFAPLNIEIEGFSQEQIGYHCFLLHEAGLIEAKENATLASESPSAEPFRLTWEGHEFIDNAANEKVWGEAKGVIGKLGEVSFSIWSSVLSQLVIKNLGISN